MLDTTFAILGGITLIGLVLSFIAKYIPLMIMFSALCLVIGAYELETGIQYTTGETISLTNTLANYTFSTGLATNQTNTVTVSYRESKINDTASIPLLYQILIFIIMTSMGLYCGVQSYKMRATEETTE